MTEDNHKSIIATTFPTESASVPETGVEGTRASLIRVAIELFGRSGYEATSTRDIAGVAGVNIAGIAYHFGGKAGLHRACAEVIAGTLAEQIAAPFNEVPLVVEDLDAGGAEEALIAAIGTFARFMLSRPEAEAMARFVVREQMDPTASFDVLFETVIRPRHELLSRLYGRATGLDPQDETVVIAVSALIGQVMFFRVGRATALRRLGWTEIDPAHAERIVEVILDTVRASVATRRTKVLKS